MNNRLTKYRANRSEGGIKRKTMKRIRLILIFVLFGILTLGAVSCSKDGGGEIPKIWQVLLYFLGVSFLIGTYIFISQLLKILGKKIDGLLFGKLNRKIDRTVESMLSKKDESKQKETIVIKISDISDQDALAEIAKNDKNHYTRMMAINKLTDQTILAEIAKNGNIPADVVYRAIEKLTDQTILAEIAKNDEVLYTLRVSIIEKLTNQAVLTEIAKNDKVSYVRKIAAEKLTERTILTESAKNRKDEHKNIDNISVQLKYMNEKDIRELIQKTENPEELKMIMRSRFDEKSPFKNYAVEDAQHKLRMMLRYSSDDYYCPKCDEIITTIRERRYLEVSSAGNIHFNLKCSHCNSKLDETFINENW
jgi:hypothetical protein